MGKLNPATEIGDLSGKVVFITGGNAGIGAATVRALVPHNPAIIYIGARRIDAAQEVVDSVVKEHPNAKLEVLKLDLASLESVKACAAAFNQKASRLDLLFLNAGVSGLKPGLTPEGYEVQFGINHVGHALLAQLILPKALQTVQQDPTADVRVMVTSSAASHQFAPSKGIPLKLVTTPIEGLNTMQRYASSKLANLLFARKLAQLYPQLTITSSHPGVVATDIFNKGDGAPAWVMSILGFFIPFIAVTPNNGALTQLWTATAPLGGAKGVKSGEYYEPYGVEKTSKVKWASNQKALDDLWQWTDEELLKNGGSGWPAAKL